MESNPSSHTSPCLLLFSLARIRTVLDFNSSSPTVASMLMAAVIMETMKLRDSRHAQVTDAAHEVVQPVLQARRLEVNSGRAQ